MLEKIDSYNRKKIGINIEIDNVTKNSLDLDGITFYFVAIKSILKDDHYYKIPELVDGYELNSLFFIFSNLN